MAKKTTLADRLEDARSRIAAAAERSSRDAREVRLVAVTKYAAPEQVREILQLGIGDLGESRVQQLVQRAMQLREFHERRRQMDDATVSSELRWHMIGHLQRNKVKQVLPYVAMLHSIDSLRLAEELEQHATKAEIELPVLLQVNTAEEPQKYGVAVGAATHLAEQVAQMDGISLQGLMCMAPHEASEDVTRRCFIRLREIFEELKWQKVGGEKLRHLSMGMSGDFEIAVEEGSTMVRLGSTLFGGDDEPPDSALE